MEENIILGNLFTEAIASKELDKFFLGQGKYFVQDKEFGEHWSYGSFKNYIEPYIKEHGEEQFQQAFWSGVFQVISTSTDLNIGLDVIVNYLITFYNAADPKKQEDRVKNTPQTFINTFKQSMRANKQRLVLDKRSVGTDWCSATNGGLGLWGGLIYNLTIIRKRIGLDLVPEDELV